MKIEDMLKRNFQVTLLIEGSVPRNNVLHVGTVPLIFYEVLEKLREELEGIDVVIENNYDSFNRKVNDIS